MPLNTDTIRAGASGATGASGPFYTKTIDQSLRFGPVTGSSYLARSSFGTSSGSGATCTLSVWVKRNDAPNTGYNQWFFTSGASGSAYLLGFRAANDVLSFTHDTSGVAITTSMEFRDTSAWYHIMLRIKTSESDNADKYQLYVNGSRQSVTVSGTPVTTNLGTNVVHNIGRYPTGSSYANVYLAELNFIDGQALTADSFGETKNGVWIPKDYTGSYGNNGFHLTFQNSSNIGYDYQTSDRSGTTNDFTAYNLTAVDVMEDSPTNNFCVMNRNGRRFASNFWGTFSEGNLKVVSGGNATHFFGTMSINEIASQGGIYFEVRLDSTDASRTYGGVVGDDGINNSNVSGGASYSFPIKGLIGLMASPRGYFNTATDASGSLDTSSNPTFSNGDVAGFAILSDGKFFCHRNGTYMTDTSGNTGNPSTGANPIATIDLTSTNWFPYVGYSSSFTVNFGQDGTFNGNETPAGTYTDANGIGNFNYPVPTNCLAICTSNMEEPTIGPNSTTQADDNFDIATYSGTSNEQAVPVNFQPDWTWVKNLTTTGVGSSLHDSTRGATVRLTADQNHAESTYSAGTGFRSFNSDPTGFTVNVGAATGTSSNNYVAWNWKANGGVTSTIAADSVSSGVPSVASTVQANTDAGFSIVTFPANNTNGTKVGHGLGKAPKMIITKQRPAISSWYIYHDAIGKNKWVRFNNPNSEGERTTASSTIWGNVTPDTNTFTVGNSDLGYNNGGANDVIAYCFAEIKGYSKFGSFIGNGESVDGPFIHLGFRPRYFLIFLVSSGSLHLWFVYDTERGDGIQPINPEIYWSQQSVDPQSSFEFGDFVSNGIKVRNSNSARNVSGGEFIYMAFAENPFKYANGR